MKHKKGWIHTFIPVLAGFLALYLVLMSIATLLVKETFMEDFKNSYTSMILGIEGSFFEIKEGDQWPENESVEYIHCFYDQLMNSQLKIKDSRYFQCSCALFDEDRNLLFENKNILSFLNVDGHLEEILFPADDYLNEEELRELAHLIYQWQSHFSGPSPDLSSLNSVSREEYMSKRYRITLVLEKGTDIPVRLMVQELYLNGEDNEETEDTTPDETLWFPNVPWDHSTVVWTWWNPDVRISGKPQEDFYEVEAAPGSSFPYLSYGYESWLSWQENEFLHDLRPETDTFYVMSAGNNVAQSSQPFLPRTKTVSEIHVPFPGQSGHRCFFSAAMDCHPWLAAMDSMRYFYLSGLACMLLCTCLLTFCIRRQERRRETLEESRRDLTNVMAHQLTDPLRAIRGLTENLKQNEDNPEYTLDQIIQKTEEMDSLAAELIHLSRSDPEQKE